MDSEYFYWDLEGWHVKEGAPKKLVKELEEYTQKLKEFYDNN